MEGFEKNSFRIYEKKFPRGNHIFIFFISVVLGLFLQQSAASSDLFNPSPKAVFVGPSAGAWERVECLFDAHPKFKQEDFATPTHHLDPWIIKWFGEKPAPHSGYFLLHCAKGYRGKNFKTPVLLVHGAGDNANRAWIHPYQGVLPSELPLEKQGFALALSNLGYAVFAVTFAHGHGDNFMQSEHVANAIRRIRILLERTDDPQFKVDLVAHSKGNIAVQLYCSDGRNIFPNKEFLTNYRNDVRKFIAIAAPFRGIDTAFRYYLYNLMVATKEHCNAPVAVDRMLLYGMWANMTGSSLFPDGKNFFPGQCQTLYNLAKDGKMPLGPDSFTPVDANLTMKALYFGGTTAYVSSRGINKAVEKGERLIYRLEEKGIDPRIRLGVLAGSSRYINWYVEGVGFIPLPIEIAGPPGDGVVFLASSRNVDGVLRRGAHLLGMATLDLNHLGISCKPDALKVLDSWLLTP